jgi:hypothetical protein
MKALPDRSRPKWLAMAGQIAAGTLLVAIAIGLLPVLLFLSLVMALLLIPALRQLRREANRTAMDLTSPTRDQMIDITPLHRRVERDVWGFLQRKR